MAGAGKSVPGPLGTNTSEPPAQVESDLQLVTKIPKILPHERVFPVQIGTELFKLSGASLSSDAPSYFSQYFLCQIKKASEKGDDWSSAIRTLHIDRDPVTFRDISLHLQGYHVQPRDGTHFVRLFADAQFYSLPRLISQLYEESIFMSIGHREFQIPRDLFTDPGNSPNFFTLGFAMFFSTPDRLFPGLDREDLIRPPSILPPSIPNRSAETFAELLHLLRGYPPRIHDEAHRAALLRDCRYYRFKGLEQRLIPHSIAYNSVRGREEITLRLEDMLKSGIGVAKEGWVQYARPFVDEKAHELVLEIGGEATRLHVGGGGGGVEGGWEVRAEFFGEARARIAKMLEVVCAKLNLPATTQPLGLSMGRAGASCEPKRLGNMPLSVEVVRAVLDGGTSVALDGRGWAGHLAREASPTRDDDAGERSGKRRRIEARGEGTAQEWIVRTGQWRMKIQYAKNRRAALECVLVAVKLDALSSERARSERKDFLSG